jgi:PKD repeat protein
MPQRYKNPATPPVAAASANPESGDARLAVQFSSDGSNDLNVFDGILKQ